MSKKYEIGDIITIKGEQYRVVKVWPFWTYDVETLDGKFRRRLTGMY